MRPFAVLYVVISLLAGTYSSFFGDTRHRSFFYNFGIGLTWPIGIFNPSPEVDGDSPDEFATSLVEVAESAQKNGLLPAVNAAMNLKAFYIRAKHDKSIGPAEYQQIVGDGPTGLEVLAGSMVAIRDSDDLKEEYLDYFDDMSAGDIADDLEDIREDIDELMEERA